MHGSRIHHGGNRRKRREILHHLSSIATSAKEGAPRFTTEHWLLNGSTIQPFNHSTIQRFNHSTIQRFNHSTIQRFSFPSCHPHPQCTAIGHRTLVTGIWSFIDHCVAGRAALPRSPDQLPQKLRQERHVYRNNAPNKSKLHRSDMIMPNRHFAVFHLPSSA